MFLLAFGLLATGYEAIVFQIAMTAVAIGASIAASYLLKPKIGGSPFKLDNAPTTVASKGSVIPYVIGRRRIGSVFGWAGQRQVIIDNGRSSGGGKNRRGGRSVAPTIIQQEGGWHILCVGPVKRLLAIYADGQVIFDNRPVVDEDFAATEFNSTNYPSGSTIQVQSDKSMTIYWGEEDQPVNSILGASDVVGVESRWPFLCYIYWEFALKGGRWPLLEYEIETEIQYSCPGGSNTEIDVNPGNTPHIRGVNPGHALYQLLFGEYPHGLALDDAKFDIPSLDAAIDLFETEKLASSYIIEDGSEIYTVIGQILQDTGMLIAWDPDQGKFIFKTIRSETPVAISTHATLEPLPEIETRVLERAVDKMVFGFPDKANNFKVSTIAVDDDGQASYQSYPKGKRYEIGSVIHYEVAQIVAERRSQEDLAGGAAYKIELNRYGRLLYPGCLISVPTVPEPLRVLEVTYNTNTGKTLVQAMTDFYGAEASTNVLTRPAPVQQTFPVAADLASTFIEVPAQAQSPVDPIHIIVPRIRNNNGIAYADVHVSADDVTYVNKGREPNVQTGGTLIDGLTATDPYYIDSGPTFTLLGPDVGIVRDYTSDEESWKAGRQLALIGEELFFLRSIEAVAGSTYRLRGLLRARFDTVRAAHAVGDKVFIFLDGEITRFADLALSPGKTIYVKPQPYSLTTGLSLGSITALTKTLYGKGLRPMKVSGLRVKRSGARYAPAYSTGEDIPLFWTYRAQLQPWTAAGMFPAGDAVGAALPEIGFVLEFYTLADVLKDTKSTAYQAAATYTYSNAALVAAFGSEQSFKVKVYQVNGGMRSDAVTLTVSLV